MLGQRFQQVLGCGGPPPPPITWRLQGSPRSRGPEVRHSVGQRLELTYPKCVTSLVKLKLTPFFFFLRKWFHFNIMLQRLACVLEFAFTGPRCWGAGGFLLPSHDWLLVVKVPGWAGSGEGATARGTSPRSIQLTGAAEE